LGDDAKTAAAEAQVRAAEEDLPKAEKMLKELKAREVYNPGTKYIMDGPGTDAEKREELIESEKLLKAAINDTEGRINRLKETIKNKGESVIDYLQPIIVLA